MSNIPQVKDLYKLVQRGWSLEAAVEKLWPGADPTWWERKLEKFDPVKVTSPAPCRQSTSRFAKCNLTANIRGKLNGGNGSSTPAPVTPLTIWDRVQQKVNDQDISLTPGASEIIWEGGKQYISLRRDSHQEEIRLVAKIGSRPSILSRPVIRWGRDRTYRNGDARGIWKMTLSAEHNYAQWQNEVNA